VLARAMYERFGFVRTREFDIFYDEVPFSVEAPLHLIAYALTLPET